MKILMTGANGMLAQAVKRAFSGNEMILTDAKELDITDEAAVLAAAEEMRPELIINCAAFTNVDGAETAGEIVQKVNADGPGNLAKAAKEIGATLVHISTDYVFGGEKGRDENGVEFDEDDEKAPETVYGKTKLAGEQAIEENCEKYYIFRTAWLYGKGGKNFVDTMISVAEGRDEVTVVDDQHGSPTYAEDLADVIKQAVEKEIPHGVYHATNEGFTTWADFTREIYRQAGIKCEVKGVSTEEYEKNAGKTVAPRPRNSKMSKAKLKAAGIEIEKWEEALAKYLSEKKEEND